MSAPFRSFLTSDGERAYVNRDLVWLAIPHATKPGLVELYLPDHVLEVIDDSLDRVADKLNNA